MEEILIAEGVPNNIILRSRDYTPDFDYPAYCKDKCLKFEPYVNC